ncbi:hypothetical protein SLE2022_083770 [Rubroshorea leprosula]
MDLMLSKTLVFSLLVVYVSVSIVPISLAEEPSKASVAVKPDNVFECIGDIVKVGGCVDAVKKAIDDNNFADLGKQCCDVLVGIGDDCWPILFPNEPTVPILIKAICAFVKEKKDGKGN